jgi:MSHA pilin protein MshA
MGGAINSAAQMAHGKALIEGVTHLETANIDYNGDGSQELEIRFGYPSGSRTNGIPRIMSESFATQWTWSTNYSRSVFYLTTAYIGGYSGNYVNNTRVTPTNCYLAYKRAVSAGSTPLVEYVTTGC